MGLGRCLVMLLFVLAWLLSVLFVAYRWLSDVKVEQEKVYVLKYCRCRDYLKFREQYRIGVLVDEKGRLCALKCR